MDEENKRGSKGVLWLAVIAGVLILGAGAISWVIHPHGFWKLTIGNVLTLLVAVMLSFLFVQWKAEKDREKADKREQKEAAIRLLGAMQELIADKAAYEVSKNEDVQVLTTIKRRLSNYIKILEEHSAGFGLDREIEFIKEKFNEYDSFIGNHMSDVAYLEKSSCDLRRPLDLIDYKIYEMIFILHK